MVTVVLYPSIPPDTGLEALRKVLAETAIGTKFAPSYTCIFMDQVETEFRET